MKIHSEGATVGDGETPVALGAVGATGAHNNVLLQKSTDSKLDVIRYLHIFGILKGKVVYQNPLPSFLFVTK